MAANKGPVTLEHKTTIKIQFKNWEYDFIHSPLDMVALVQVMSHAKESFWGFKDVDGTVTLYAIDTIQSIYITPVE